LLSPLFYVILGVGIILISGGGYLCLKWYVFWKLNYRGQLITDGPYKWVRHPFYTGYLALTTGLALLIPIIETVMLVVFSVGVILYYIPREEEFLLRRYGEAYRDYQRLVPWRIIPIIF
jgi:protein-S-isoprenylcysteine O-methyltransferase Ste14